MTNKTLLAFLAFCTCGTISADRRKCVTFDDVQSMTKTLWEAAKKLPTYTIRDQQPSRSKTREKALMYQISRRIDNDIVLSGLKVAESAIDVIEKYAVNVLENIIKEPRNISDIEQHARLHDLMMRTGKRINVKLGVAVDVAKSISPLVSNNVAELLLRNFIKRLENVKKNTVMPIIDREYCVIAR